MNINDLQIDGTLKAKLSLLIEEFESYRISSKVIDMNNNVISKKESVIENEKKKDTKHNFFHKFFFSEVV